MTDGYVSDGGVKPIPAQTTTDGTFGAEVQPKGFKQDMNSSIEVIAGAYPPRARDASPADFTGGMGGTGLGGQAEPPAPMKGEVP